MTRRPERVLLRCARPLGGEEPCPLGVEIVAGDGPLELTVDLYDLERPIHPEGHYGWHAWEVGDARTFEFRLRAEKGAEVECDRPARRSWSNPELDIAGAEAVGVHVALRAGSGQPPIVDRAVPWLRSAAAHRAAETLLAPRTYLHDVVPPRLGLAEGATVHLSVTDLRSGDAIGNLALDAARVLLMHDVPVRLWANSAHGPAAGWADAPDSLPATVRPGDVLLHQYSTADPGLDDVLAAPIPKLCFYQGVTPPELLEASDPEAARACVEGRAELPRLAGFDGFVAGSRFTADELCTGLGRDVEVAICPPTLNLDRFRELEAAPVALPESGRFLLYVGRFSPHKGVDLLLDAFAAQHANDPKLALVLAGQPAGPAIDAQLEARRKALPAAAAERVHLVRGASDAQLKTLFEACTAYVSASRHEGFCVPLVEAMAFGKPVIAFEAPAVVETLGGAACTFATRDPAALASIWHGLLSDPAALAAQTGRQDARLAELREAANGRILWDALARVSRAARPS